MNIQQANGIDIIAFLEKEGFSPCKVGGDNYWYLSPLRNEKTPSFKVSKRLNKWYDYGMAEGGDLVELAKRLKGFSTVAETLCSLGDGGIHSIRSVSAAIGKTCTMAASTMKDIELLPLQNKALFYYLQTRHIDSNIGAKHCLEIHYTVKHKRYFGIAFGNISNGYEIRNPYFKGCIGHKDISIIHYSVGEWQTDCLVFEGFMDFLSFLTLAKSQDRRFLIEGKCDYIIMNSICNLRKTLSHLERYRHIHCFLDNDLAGKNTLETICALYEHSVTDESFRYADYKDVNDCLMGKKRNNLYNNNV